MPTRLTPLLPALVLASAAGCSARPTEEAPRARAPASLTQARAMLAARSTLSGKLAPTRAVRALGVELPDRASDGVVLSDEPSGVQLRFRLRGARDAPVRVHEGIGVSDDASTAASAWLVRPNGHGVEDLVLIEHPVDGIEYEVDVAGAAGVRFVARVLELLDWDGNPRLRAVAPFGVDREGELVPLMSELRGCTHDTDPRASQGRPMVRPAEGTCTLRLSWESDVAYPLLVDPAWTTTGAMAYARRGHEMARLPTGRVLVSSHESPLAASEIYDPPSGTWAATADILAARSRTSFVPLVGGKVLVLGDSNGPEAQLYDETTGLWTQTGSQVSGRNTSGRAVRLTNGDVLVVGGLFGPNSALAEVYDPTAGTWSTHGTLNEQRVVHAIIELDDGRVLVAGGQENQDQNVNVRTSAEVWTPGTSTWTLVGSLSVPRTHVWAVKLPNGKILVAGGYRHDQLPKELATSEVFDPVSNTWSAGPTMTKPRWGYRVEKLADGRFLYAGGCSATSASAQDSELLDAQGTAFVAGGAFAEGLRCDHAAAPLPGGRMLISGGGNVHASSEVWAPVASGGACTLTSECALGLCVDGACCSSSCTGTCESCKGTETGGQDGVCAPIVGGTDPDKECGSCRACNGSGQCAPDAAGTDVGRACADTGSPVCEENGWCDGAGACQKYASSSGCTPEPCSTDVECASGHCADGVCCDEACAGACEACTAAKKGAGVDGECAPVGADTDPDDDCSAGPGFPTSCLADGACDGAGVCRVFAKDTVSCGATQCIGGNAQGLLCNGAGQCLTATSGCEPYACTGNQCAQMCTQATDCVTTAYCSSQGACVPKQPSGEACTAGKECQNGFCADGLCCTEACTGRCEACNVAPNEGTCSPVTGEPEGSRPPCVGAGECKGACDGVSRPTCSVPPSGQICGTPGCEGTKASFSECDGRGACVAKTKECSPFACAATACAATCTDASGCTQGYNCDSTTGNCVPAATTCAPDGVTVVTSTGERRDCSPFVCEAAACSDPCVTSSQCVGGFVCDEGNCVAPAAQPTGDEPGCGCRVPTESDRSRLGWGACLLACVAGRRRASRVHGNRG